MIYKWPIIIFTAIFVLLGMFALGRYTASDKPEKVIIQEKIKIVELEKQVVVVQEKIKVERIRDLNQQQSIHREEYTITHPNGLKEEHKSEDINVNVVIKEKDIQYVDRITEKETIKYQDRYINKEVKVETKRPDWRVGPLVGYNINDFSLLTPTNGLVFGGIAERRIYGPFSIGAWGISSGMIGAVATIEF